MYFRLDSTTYDRFSVFATKIFVLALSLAVAAGDWLLNEYLIE
jgi:hypothetical protein